MGEHGKKVKGKVKQAAGALADDPELVREGRADELEGDVEGVGKSVKRAGKKIKEAVRDTLK